MSLEMPAEIMAVQHAPSLSNPYFGGGSKDLQNNMICNDGCDRKNMSADLGAVNQDFFLTFCIQPSKASVLLQSILPNSYHYVTVSL